MIRIGFDPMLEAQQRQQEIIKAVRHYHFENDEQGSAGSRSAGANKFLALVGSKIASLGSGLEKRFGGSTKSDADFATQVSGDGCR